MICPKLAGRAVELRLHVEALGGADVEKLRAAGSGAAPLLRGSGSGRNRGSA